MKAILDLTKAIKDREFYNKQFEGGGTEKNILFVSPQLTSKHLYKFILPFFSLYTKEIHPAITSLSKYNPLEQIVNLDTTLSSVEIMWADFIVFPFTTHDLSKNYGLYEAIREMNPLAKIVFCVDLNYYEVPKDHPFHELFQQEGIKEQVERNILKADFAMSTNRALDEYLFNKFNGFIQDKYKSFYTKVIFTCVPYLIDEEIVSQNIEFESQKPAVINKEIFKKIAEVAEELKKEDLKINKEKAVKINNKKLTPKKATAKTKKVTGKKTKKGKKGKKDKEVGQIEQVEEQKIEPTVSENNTVAEVPISEVPAIIVPEIKIVELPKKYRIGIICSPENYGDIKDFNEQFQIINDKFGDQVTLIFIGYDYKNDKNKILDGVNFEYIEPVSVVHFPKQLRLLELNLVIVPIRKSVFNIASEDIDKYLECSLLNIPLFTHDMFPYNFYITDKRNGFLHEEKANFIWDLEHILKNPDLMYVVGKQCKIDCINNYTYTPNNIKLMSSVYQL